MKEFTIYQLSTECNNYRGKIFRHLDSVKFYMGGVSKGDYKAVYTSTIKVNEKDVYDTLEEIFKKFNLNRPSDFEGHSLSVSDVVVLDGVAYYCDSFGFEKIDF